MNHLGLLLTLALAATASAQSADDPFADADDPFADADDPFADAEDPFADAEDPFADAEDPFADPDDPEGGAGSFDPDAVELAEAAEGFEFHGRVNLTAAFTDRRDERVESLEEAGGGSFDLSSLDLYASWFPSRYVGLLGELELERDLEVRDRELEIELELAVLEVRPLGNDGLRIGVGYFPVPFGIERRFYAPPRNPLPNRPAAFRRLFPGTYADLGARLHWRHGVSRDWGADVELELAVVRGLEGLDRDGRPRAGLRDAQDEPAYTGRVGWTVFHLDPGRRGATDHERSLPCAIRLTLGGSLYWGRYDERGRRALRYEALDVELEVGPVLLRAEAIARTAQGPVPGDPDPDDRTRRGHGGYVLASLRLPVDPRPGLESLHLNARYGWLDRDRRRVEEFDLQRIHVGVSWSPLPGVLIKLSGQRLEPRRGGAEHSGYLEIGYSF